MSRPHTPTFPPRSLADLPRLATGATAWALGRPGVRGLTLLLCELAPNGRPVLSVSVLADPVRFTEHFDPREERVKGGAAALRAVLSRRLRAELAAAKGAAGRGAGVGARKGG